ncbi:hypothetical protein HaLaN_25099 [Haematococcus lacustris]|uniref:Uncharacterized protein n=1 Tax=Haematococcus lacustris TaxID=44745 RepID=A0A6A0A455_HAELA|nr:hypothetical protein HaLaN_25099 [Haematococcus lacustris]
MMSSQPGSIPTHALFWCSMRAVGWPQHGLQTSTLRHTVVSGTCNAQQQSEHVLLLACGRDDGSRDNWTPLSAFGAAAGASALPAALLRSPDKLAHPGCAGRAQSVQAPRRAAWTPLS